MESINGYSLALYLSNLTFLAPVLVLFCKKKGYELGIILFASLLFTANTFCDISPAKCLVGQDVLDGYNLAIYIELVIVLHSLLLSNFLDGLESKYVGAWLLFLHIVGISITVLGPDPFAVHTVLFLIIVVPDLIRTGFQVRPNLPMKLLVYPMRAFFVCLVMVLAILSGHPLITQQALIVLYNLLFLTTLRIKNCPYFYPGASKCPKEGGGASEGNCSYKKVFAKSKKGE